MAARARELLRRLVAYAWDNPTAEHDARAILAAHKVGLWLGLEVLAIAITSAIVLLGLADGERVVRDAIVGLGTGPLLIFVTLGVVTLFLTFFVPLRAVGLLEGPRWRGYMDQLVTTGITPLRYHAGKWASSQPFFLALLAASLPFVTLFGLLGGATVGWTLAAYALLYAYANLLLVVTMALSVAMHEALALCCSWALFGGLILLDLFPAPSSAACFTPVRYLIQPVVRALAGSSATVAERLYGPPHPFGVEVPWLVWAAVVWSVLAAVAVVNLLVGPPHAFVPGLNNFGAVVLPGDRGRAFFRRVRPLAQRRVELAFLFENRGPRLVRLDLPLRCAQQVTLAVLLAALALSVVFDRDVIAELRSAPDFLVAVQLACGGALALTLGLLAGGWSRAMLRCPVGRARVPGALFDLGAFVVVAAALVTLHAAGFAATWSDLAQLRPVYGVTGGLERLGGPADVFAASSTILGAQLVTAFAALLAMKVVGTRVLGDGQPMGAAAVFVLAVVFLPFFFAVVGDGLAREQELAFLRPYASTAFFFGLASPATHVLVHLQGVPRSLPNAGGSFLLTNGFWLWQLALLAFLGAYAWAGHRSLLREAEALERLGDDAPPPPPPGATPCAACGCALAVPAGFTSWGGVVGTRLVGLVRCLDCKAEYVRATGRPPGLIRLGFMLGQAGLMVVATIALLVLVHVALARGA